MLICSLCSGFRATMLIYAFATEVYRADLRGLTPGSSDTAPVCATAVYLYTLCVWGAVKASAGNSIILSEITFPCVALESAPLMERLQFTRHVYQSACNSFRVYGKLTKSLTPPKSSHGLNKSNKKNRWTWVYPDFNSLIDQKTQNFFVLWD